MAIRSNPQLQAVPVWS